MKTCVERVFAPAVANVIMPRWLLCLFVAEDGGFNDAKLADYPNALKALNLLRAIPGGASDKEWRASVKEAGLLDGKNPRQQWAALKGRLTTEDAVDFESSTKRWTARTPTPAAQ